MAGPAGRLRGKLIRARHDPVITHSRLHSDAAAQLSGRAHHAPRPRLVSRAANRPGIAGGAPLAFRGLPPRPASRCNVGVNALDPALPVIGSGVLAGVRKSARSKWRAAVLISVHAVIAAHITYFLVAGRTLSPIEPSESMYTLELGYVNCGFIFFAIALGTTLVFGRFFCGWACHIVALQDLCAWLMKKAGVRPRPFRARLLALAPLTLALYMFVWPTALRLKLSLIR